MDSLVSIDLVSTSTPFEFPRLLAFPRTSAALLARSFFSASAVFAAVHSGRDMTFKTTIFDLLSPANLTAKLNALKDGSEPSTATTIFLGSETWSDVSALSPLGDAVCGFDNDIS